MIHSQRGTVRSPCKWQAPQAGLPWGCHHAEGPIIQSSLRGLVTCLGLEPHAPYCLATQEDKPPPVPRTPAFPGNSWASGTRESWRRVHKAPRLGIQRKEYKHHIFFTHSSTDGYLGGLHVLAVVNSATLNIGVYVSFWIIVLPGCTPRSEIGGSYVPFSTPSPVLVICGLFHGGRSDWCDTSL